MAKATSPERRRSRRAKEIVFQGEGYDRAIRRGKCSTIRLNSGFYESLCPGDEVMAVCRIDQDDENPTRIPLVILAKEKAPLLEQDRAVLATNGFMSHKQAADRLTEIYGKKVSLEDETINLVYLPRDVFEALPSKQQILCLILSADQLVRDRRTREIFLPSIFFTAAYEGMNLLSWLDFCVFTGIAGIHERDRLVRLIQTDPYIGEKEANQMFSEPDRMWDVLDAKAYAVYDRLVLLRPVKRNGVIHPELE